MIVKATHVVIKPGHNIGNTSLTVTLVTVNSATRHLLDVNTKQLEVTGTYNQYSPSDEEGGGSIDVVIEIADKIVIYLNNPIFGYPYTIFVDSDNGSEERHNYYENEEHTYVDSVGQKYSCTRNIDSENKEFTILIKD